MTDYTELQKAAAYAAQDTIKFADEDEEMRAFQQFHEEISPETVLALIADLDEARNGMKHSCAIRLKKQIEQLEKERDQLKAENEALRKDSERLQSATAFVLKLRDAAVKQPSVATGYLHDILSAMGKEEQS